MALDAKGVATRSGGWGLQQPAKPRVKRPARLIIPIFRSKYLIAGSCGSSPSPSCTTASTCCFAAGDVLPAVCQIPKWMFVRYGTACERSWGQFWKQIGMCRAGGLKRNVAQHHRDVMLDVVMFLRRTFGLGSAVGLACESRRCKVTGGSGLTQENDCYGAQQYGKVKERAA